MNRPRVYLDNQATTPVDPRVREAMLPFFSDRFGNPHSNSHAYGWEAADEVRSARSQVAQLINADDDEIVFTSGATESCNIALRGVAKAAVNGRKKIITVATEHPAVLETVDELGQCGYEAVILPVASDGIIDLTDLERELDDQTLIVSVMAANNEIGVLQPLPEIGRLCRSRGALFHTDSTQAVGRMDIDVDAWKIDLLSLSGHKIYGPKGIGALFARSGIRLSPITSGGGQEHGIRPGTVPAPLVIGLGEACRLAREEGQCDALRISKLTKRLETDLRATCPNMRLFGHARNRVSGNLNIGFPGYDAESVINNVSSEIAISTGSACTSGNTEPSRVLLALGLDSETAASGVRISLGRFTTDDDITIALDALSIVADSVRRRLTS